MKAQLTFCRCPFSSSTSRRASVRPKKECLPVAVTLASISPWTTTAPARTCTEAYYRNQAAGWYHPPLQGTVHADFTGLLEHRLETTSQCVCGTLLNTPSCPKHLPGLLAYV